MEYRCIFCETTNPKRHDISCPKYRIPTTPEPDRSKKKP
jgi:hypothetical protein